MDAVRAPLDDRGSAFRSLKNRNFALYFGGQLISQTGTWAQMTVLSWQVLELSGSSTVVGVLTAAMFGPLLLLGPWAGVLADRHDKLRIMRITQTIAMAQAVALAWVVLSGRATVHNLLLLSLAYGVIFAIDNPARRSLMIEMVDPVDIPNATSLNSVIMSGTKIVGPAVGGILLARFGAGAAYVANAASFVAVLAALFAIRRSELRLSPRAAAGPGAIRAGIKEAWDNPTLRLAFQLMIPVGTLGFNFSVLVPVFAKYVLHGGANTFTMLSSMASVGALGGSLVIARRTSVRLQLLVWLSAAFGVASVGLALSVNTVQAVVAAMLASAAGVAFIASANTVLQLCARPEMRGRVMALSAIVFVGSTPIGGPLLGWVADIASARWAMMLAASGSLGAAAWGAWVLRNSTSPIGLAGRPPQPASPA